MKRLSRERLGELRSVPLGVVAQALGYERSKLDRSKWRKSGSIVSISKTQFYDHLSESGGGGAIDLALHARGGGFADAISFLETLAPPQSIQQAEWLAVHSYLHHRRSIDAEVIEKCRIAGTIKADSKYNARFAMRNCAGDIIGSEIVGTCASKRFRGLSKGASKQAGGFWITTGQSTDPKKCTSAMLVESAIDALSVVSLKMPDTPQLIVSTAGILYTLPNWLAELNLELIVCGYDADAPAQLAAEQLKTDSRVVRLEPKDAKDWNEMLADKMHRNCKFI